MDDESSMTHIWNVEVQIRLNSDSWKIFARTWIHESSQAEIIASG